MSAPGPGLFPSVQPQIVTFLVVTKAGERTTWGTAERPPERPAGARYTRDSVRGVLHLLGCKPRHAYKVVQLLFTRITALLPELARPAHRRSQATTAWSVWPHAQVSAAQLQPGTALSGGAGTGPGSMPADSNHTETFTQYEPLPQQRSANGTAIEAPTLAGAAGGGVTEVAVALPRSDFNEMLCACLSEYKYKYAAASEELRVACSLRERRRCVVVLLCGTSGSGKSTLASILASRMGITTVISTDSVRHMLRSYHTREDAPLLWASTYQAGDALQQQHQLHQLQQEGTNGTAAKVGQASKASQPTTGDQSCEDNAAAKESEQAAQVARAIKGYKAQCEVVVSHLDGLISGFEASKQSAVIEGVHLNISQVVKLMQGHPSVVPFLAYIRSEAKHIERMAVRAKYMTLDPLKNRYVAHMTNIRWIQDYLVRKADAHAIPKVENTNVDRSVGLIHLTLMGVLRRLARGESLLEQGTGAARGLAAEYNSAVEALAAASTDVVAHVRALRGQHAAEVALSEGVAGATQLAAEAEQQGTSTTADELLMDAIRPVSAPPVPAASIVSVVPALLINTQVAASEPVDICNNKLLSTSSATETPLATSAAVHSPCSMPAEHLLMTPNYSISPATSSALLPATHSPRAPPGNAFVLNQTANSQTFNSGHAADSRQRTVMADVAEGTNRYKSIEAGSSSPPHSSHEPVLGFALKPHQHHEQASPKQQVDAAGSASHAAVPASQPPHQNGRVMYGRGHGRGWGSRHHGPPAMLPTVASDDDEEDDSVVAAIARHATQQAQRAVIQAAGGAGHGANADGVPAGGPRPTAPGMSALTSPAAALAGGGRAGPRVGWHRQWIGRGRRGTTGVMLGGVGAAQSPFLSYANGVNGNVPGDEDGDDEEEGAGTSASWSAAGRLGSIGSVYRPAGGGHSSAAESEVDAHLLHDYASLYESTAAFDDVDGDLESDMGCSFTAASGVESIVALDRRDSTAAVPLSPAQHSTPQTGGAVVARHLASVMARSRTRHAMLQAALTTAHPHGGGPVSLSSPTRILSANVPSPAGSSPGVLNSISAQGRAPSHEQSENGLHLLVQPRTMTQVRVLLPAMRTVAMARGEADESQGPRN